VGAPPPIQCIGGTPDPKDPIRFSFENLKAMVKALPTPFMMPPKRFLISNKTLFLLRPITIIVLKMIDTTQLYRNRYNTVV
jgi:hypothetical protein